jgi:predicted GIY-YIG superfamily endonuclease
MMGGKVARPFYAYILGCSDGTYYVGHTDELARRLAEHETGATWGYTAARRPVRLVWFEEFPTREEAKAAEAQVKKSPFDTTPRVYSGWAGW